MIEYFDYDIENETALDNLTEGLQLIGFDWRYLYANKSVMNQSKYSLKKDLIGFTMMEKYPNIEKTEMFSVLEQCMRERISRTIENEFEFPDNSKGWFELRIRPVPEGIFILSIDITEQKKVEEKKKEHIKDLEEMMFITSHKVREPITQILGVSNLLGGTKLSQEDLIKMVDYMKESALTLDVMTKELTTFMHEMKLKAETIL